MNKIRIGKDINILWEIKSETADLSSLDLTLFIVDPKRNKSVLQFFLDEDNRIRALFPGVNQFTLGTYRLELWANFGKEGQSALDIVEAFRLVENTDLEDSDQDDLAVATLTLSGTLVISNRGVGIKDIRQEGSYLIITLDDGREFPYQILGNSIWLGSKYYNEF